MDQEWGVGGRGGFINLNLCPMSTTGLEIQILESNKECSLVRMDLTQPTKPVQEEFQFPDK